MSSTSSESSLPELPQPYDISTAVSKALSVDRSANAVITVKPEVDACSNNNANNNCQGRSARSASFPSYSYDMQISPVNVGIHNRSSYTVGDCNDSYSAAANPYYGPGPTTPYSFFPHHHPLPDSTQFLYSAFHSSHHHHRQSQLPPLPPPLPPSQIAPRFLPTPILHHQVADPPISTTVPVDMEPWNEAAMSICNSSAGSYIDSHEKIELDKFCKYFDSSGEEEFMGDKDGGSSSGDGYSGAVCGGTTRVEASMLVQAKKQRKYFITGSACREMLDSPPKRKHRSVCSLPNFYRDSRDTRERVYSPRSVEQRNWVVELDNTSMWLEFDSLGTEMVITKAGRRMFPTLVLKVSGLDPRDSYSVKLNVVPADHRRYKYLQSEWVAVGRSDKKQIYREYEHPDSPNSGSYWMDKTVAFKMVKLTNNKATKSSDQIILNSMHKYIPCMKITSLKDGYCQSFSFPETSFIAVTAYQSDDVTDLKINHNPYARAFRGGHKAGGHYRLTSSKRTSSSSTRSSRSSTPFTSPAEKAKSKQTDSAASMESGFESDPGNAKKESQSHPFNSSSSSLITGWPEEGSMWGNNFCNTYMDTSRVALEYEVEDSAEGESGEGEILETLPDPNINLGLHKVEAAIPIEDDVFF